MSSLQGWFYDDFSIVGILSTRCSSNYCIFKILNSTETPVPNSRVLHQICINGKLFRQHGGHPPESQYNIIIILLFKPEPLTRFSGISIITCSESQKSAKIQKTFSCPQTNGNAIRLIYPSRLNFRHKSI